jgi:SAM-dependent methyltransferase
MNSSHSKLTDWGLKHISIENYGTILDVGCGGGRTVSKLAAISTQGKVYGIDYSDESVAATKKNECTRDRSRPRRGPTRLCVSVAVSGQRVPSAFCRGNTLLVAKLAR